MYVCMYVYVYMHLNMSTICICVCIAWLLNLFYLEVLSSVFVYMFVRMCMYVCMYACRCSSKDVKYKSVCLSCARNCVYMYKLRPYIRSRSSKDLCDCHTSGKCVSLWSTVREAFDNFAGMWCMYCIYCMWCMYVCMYIHASIQYIYLNTCKISKTKTYIRTIQYNTMESNTWKVISLSTCIHTYIHKYIHTVQSSSGSSDGSTYIYTYKHVCIHLYILYPWNCVVYCNIVMLQCVHLLFKNHIYVIYTLHTHCTYTWTADKEPVVDSCIGPNVVRALLQFLRAPYLVESSDVDDCLLTLAEGRLGQQPRNITSTL